MLCRSWKFDWVRSENISKEFSLRSFVAKIFSFHFKVFLGLRMLHLFFFLPKILSIFGLWIHKNFCDKFLKADDDDVNAKFSSRPYSSLSMQDWSRSKFVFKVVSILSESFWVRHDDVLEALPKDTRQDSFWRARHLQLLSDRILTK